MRLRITVRRHNLPDCSIIWDVNTETSAPTISELLDQVNDVVPIESAEWGLEDYAVEVRGKGNINYECLHFQPVGRVMKDEDEVIIRPLLTQDLRVRRISGRHQISSDGKHLIDGIAFGRPMLRRPANRPAIDIPPRKRRRLMINEDENDEEQDQEATGSDLEQISLDAIWDDEDDEEDEDFEPVEDEDEQTASNQQLVLRADFEDDDEDDDEDFEPEDIEDEDMEELSDVDGASEAPQNQSIASQNGEEESAEDGELSAADQVVLAGVKNELTRTTICKLHAAFPKATMSVIKYVLKGSDGDASQAYEALTIGYIAAKSKSFVAETPSPLASPLSVSKRESSRVNKTAISTNNAAASNDMDLDDDEDDAEEDEDEDSILQHYDHHGLPKGSINSGKALAFMAEAVGISPKAKTEANMATTIKTRNSKPLSQDLSNGLTSTPAIDIKLNGEDDSESSSSEEETSSSDSDDDSSSDDEAGETKSINASSSDSESDNDSDSSSESSSDEEAAPEVQSSKSDSSVQRPTPVVIEMITEPQSRAPPGQGKKTTRSRNLRRKQAVALAKLQEKQILPADTKVTEYNQLEVNSNTSPEEAFAALAALRANLNVTSIQDETSNSAEFEARRRSLLASLASGGIEVGRKPSKQARRQESVASDKVAASLNPSKFVTDASKHAKNNSDGKYLATSGGETPEISPPDNAAAELNNSDTASRQTKLDLGAGRRLVFGALGLKNPKTKQDEEKLRSDLLEDVRPQKLADSVNEPLRKSPLPPVDDDSWKSKIIYRAVECCHEGVVLSEPPFPFVQRWDPQQGGKRKGQHQNYNEEPRKSKKQKRRKGKNNHSEEKENLDESYYQEDTMETQSTELSPPARQIDNIELMTNAEGLAQTTDDLVNLPADPSTLPSLTAEIAKPDMVIAFKQYIMDETTNWQPQISSYRTASIVAANENGEISMILAQRDREIPTRQYDESGQRIWGKFEMPDDEEGDEEEEDNGERTLFFNELVEPKIVTPVPVSLSTETSEASLTIGESVIVSNENESEAPLSHVTETQLHSDVEPSASAEIPKGDTTPPHSANLSTEILLDSITDSDKEQISRMIKEAGFRSNVPSSVTRKLDSNVPETSDGAAELERLRRIMTEIDGHPYSPKFNGFGSSSPIRQQRSITPTEKLDQVSKESFQRDAENSSQRAKSQESVNSSNEASRLQDNRAGKRIKKVNVDKAQAKWEAFQPKRKSAAPEPMDVDTIVVDTTSVEYPKLSGGSSFTSMVTDHGRQPDFNFEDSGSLGINTSRGNNGETFPTMQNNDNSGLEPQPEPELPQHRSRSVETPINRNEMVEPSSDNFPTVEEILSQHSQTNTQRERSASRPLLSKSQIVAEKSKKVLAAFSDTQSSNIKAEMKSKKVLAAFSDSDSDPELKSKKVLAAFSDSDSESSQAKAEAKSKLILAAFGDSDSSDNEYQDEITPKPSKPSKPPTSQTRTADIPQGSQIMDLTLSSDVEPESEDDNNAFQMASGWGAKKSTTLEGLKTQNKNGLSNTSKTSLNSKSFKKRF